ncbi:hypothetical protein D3C85_1180550 [compost metagenome]
MRAGAVVWRQLAFVDPQASVLLPCQVGLQAAAVQWVLAPGRVLEAVVAGARLIGGFAEQHLAQLIAQGQHVLGGVQRVA